eukprot:TRINITY_DN47973_c0_g1_i1.p1 TRINITY_DN47973_c0_g1~~TRINITY_DN47973_c0_g1_i1.p1  ORF type:complete len:321 (-),score=19.26 TRINITY_DN47973_c0_g1_i1:810-1727(-)
MTAADGFVTIAEVVTAEFHCAAVGNQDDLTDAKALTLDTVKEQIAALRVSLKTFVDKQTQDDEVLGRLEADIHSLLMILVVPDTGKDHSGERACDVESHGSGASSETRGSETVGVAFVPLPARMTYSSRSFLSSPTIKSLETQGCWGQPLSTWMFLVAFILFCSARFFSIEYDGIWVPHPVLYASYAAVLPPMVWAICHTFDVGILHLLLQESDVLLNGVWCLALIIAEQYNLWYYQRFFEKTSFAQAIVFSISNSLSYSGSIFIMSLMDASTHSRRRKIMRLSIGLVGYTVVYYQVRWGNKSEL